jgi:hypothetical protein
MVSAWSSNGCIEQQTQGVLSFCIQVTSPVVVLLFELSSQADVLACSPMHAAAGLSHRLFPAITWSPLYVLWLACAGPTAYLDPGQSLDSREDPYPLPVTVTVPLAAPRDGLHRRSVAGCQSRWTWSRQCWSTGHRQLARAGYAGSQSCGRCQCAILFPFRRHLLSLFVCIHGYESHFA